MTNFIDKHYEKITWFILLLGFILLFVANEYLSIALFSYLIIKAIKFRKSIRTRLQKTPRSTMIIYALGMVVLIVALTVTMLASGSFIKKHTIPGLLQSVYIIVVLIGSMFFYAWFMEFLVKVWNKKTSK
ncbi:hypothetical protein MKY34_04780 [Sporosarcina sp. FSL K6-1522]|uniref:hypothetical protein n=1 Tax=Sporosarcina sp. FSL K6-1522 TaxID=2921554 RepID=UPI003159C5FB